MSQQTAQLDKAIRAMSQEQARAGTRALVEFVISSLLLVAIYQRVLHAMVLHWYADQDYSHGFLIPPLAAYFVWQRRKKLLRTPVQPSWWGVGLLVLGSLMFAVGRLGVELMNLRASFVVTLIGLVVLLLGRPIARVLAFPLLFLFLMIPLPQSLVNVVAFPLQLIAADAAVNIVQMFGIPALREGNIIHLANASLFVAEACSGLRSLMALITLGIVFAYFFRKTLAERLIIVASAIPIAVLANAVRVALTGILTHYYGQDVAGGVVHETQGLVTFGLAFLVLLGEAWVLALIWPRRPRTRPTEELRR